ncbi:Phytanoyl-CoA dioxygenase (PhyH) [Actinopolymorpha cephalotaxi]|uniref:Ectoine hydroxylase-related dioxygenase (Phytanoyl-CoA dioxygenase family) n=1 Tax=Actinopolymorpha cephalotaxi TaxID=504797 RepID=A0A1I2ZWB8_9ACTN|nr:phytanoyl-CoA dioxygenase family protein [Actinopolymorpha cephalotaxi]NYH84207.1 ectoine hydroxylase-related dioxygenase (phytanoyl-CoA dioxygenase family) [Actinopolymorpha cephalotaxi]SFH42127.1 Phytanoyl-CoA dioxygenase (PhyH) [Actinopolymorpha cephalotaxi]
MLTDEQTARFESDGLLPLPQAVPATTALAMRDRLWAFLSIMHGRRHDDPTTWSAIEGRVGFKTLMRAGAFDGLSEHLSEPVTDLLGTAWKPPAHWGHPLVTFPNLQAQWAIPARNWHVDSTQWSTGPIPGVVAFTFLNEVRPRGGGTLVMAGSHHLTWELCRQAGGFMKTSTMKAVLAERHSWFADLWREPVTGEQQLRRYLDEGDVVEGTHLRVVELCGRPGDVVLMNQDMLHVAAPNTLDTPRMMLSDFITRIPDEEPG